MKSIDQTYIQAPVLYAKLTERVCLCVYFCAKKLKWRKRAKRLKMGVTLSEQFALVVIVFLDLDFPQTNNSRNKVEI